MVSKVYQFFDLLNFLSRKEIRTDAEIKDMKGIIGNLYLVADTVIKYGTENNMMMI